MGRGARIIGPEGLLRARSDPSRRERPMSLLRRRETEHRARQRYMRANPPLVVAHGTGNPLLSSRKFAKDLAEISLEYAVNDQLPVQEDLEHVFAEASFNTFGLPSFLDEDPRNPGADVYVLVGRPSKALDKALSEGRVRWGQNLPFVDLPNAPALRQRLIDELEAKTLAVSLKSYASERGMSDPGTYRLKFLDGASAPIVSGNRVNAEEVEKKMRHMIIHNSKYHLIVGSMIGPGPKAIAGEAPDISTRLFALDPSWLSRHAAEMSQAVRDYGAGKALAENTPYRAKINSVATKTGRRSSSLSLWRRAEDGSTPVRLVFRNSGAIRVSFSTAAACLEHQFSHPAPASKAAQVMRAGAKARLRDPSKGPIRRTLSK